MTYCGIQDWTSGGTGNIDSDPQFVRNPGPGLDGIWCTADDNYGDLRLRISSPCIDAGDNAAVPAGVTTDLGGNYRFIDIVSKPDTGSGTAPIVDMGAYEAQPLYVKATAGGLNDGSSWANGFTSLQSALAIAQPGDQLWVAAGTYMPTTGTDRIISFALASGVAVFGGFPDVGGTFAQRDWNADATTLSGDIGRPGDNSDNSYHVAVSSGTDATAILDGFTIEGGNANGSSSPDFDGGGMYNASGRPTIRNCTFSGNSALNVGGGVCNVSGSEAAFTNCVFSRDSASNDGGGMYNDASPDLTNCMFTGNTAGAFGGAMYNDSYSAPELTGCAFVANIAEFGGGAVTNYHATPKLTNCTLTANVAANGNGGAMYDNATGLLATNCIFWGNIAGDGRQIFDYGSATFLSHCDIQGGGYPGLGQIDTDPLFVRNPSPGLDGKWGTADDDYGDLRLRPASPCIDAGDNSAVPAGLVTDLAGNPRFVRRPDRSRHRQRHAADRGHGRV